MFKFCLLFALLLSFSAFAETTTSVRVDDVDEPTVRVTDGLLNDYEDVVVENSSEGNERTTPIKVYVPFFSDLVAHDKNRLTALVTFDATFGYVAVQLKVVNNSGSDRYLKIGYETSSENYTPILNYGTSLIESSSNYQIVTAIFHLNDLCLHLDCTKTNTKFDQYMYFYLDTSTNLDPVTSADKKDGAYYRFFITDITPTQTVTVSEIRRGDSRLTVAYTTNDDVSDAFKTVVFRYDVGGEQALTNYKDASGIISDEYDYDKDGEVLATGLENDILYNLAVAHMNKYQFFTQLSVSKEKAPEEIEAFLEKQACYFFSAGFQDDHYVLDRLRQFRDETLNRFYLGRLFISWYYDTAPKYTHHIYNSSTLSTFMRGVGYFVYFVLNNYIYIIISLLLLVIFLTKDTLFAE